MFDYTTQENQITTPTLHIMGIDDQVIPVDLSSQLTKLFSDPVIVTHDGGHFVPWPKSGTSQREAIIHFFEQQAEKRRSH